MYADYKQGFIFLIALLYMKYWYSTLCFGCGEHSSVTIFFIDQQTESEQVQQNVDKGKKDKKKQAAALNAGKVRDLYEKFCSCVLMWHH